MIKHASIDFEKIYFYILAFFVLSLPFSHAGVSTSIVLLALVWIAEGNFKNKYLQLRSIPIIKYIFLYLLFVSLSFFWSQNTHHALEILRIYSYWLIIPIIVTSIHTKYIDKIITIFLIAMVISEILFFGVYFDLWTIKGHDSSNPSAFMNHSVYSIYLALTGLFLINRIFSSHYQLSSKIPMTLFFISVTGNLLLAGGRTGQVAFVITIILAAILHFHASIKKLLLVAFGTLILTISAYFLVDDFQSRINLIAIDIQKVINNNDYNSSVGQRLSYWLVGKDIIASNPIFGVGIGDTMDASAQEYLKNRYNFSNEVIEFGGHFNFHNQYLEILVQNGIIGITLFILLLIQFYKLPIVNIEYKQLSIYFMTIYLIGSLFGTLFYRQFPIAFFIVFTALFIKLSIEKIPSK